MSKRKFTASSGIHIISILVLTAAFVWSNTAVGTAETASAAQRLSYAYFSSGWNLDYMQIPQAWDLIDEIKPKQQRKESDRIIVATLDTGIYYEHPDLQANIDVKNCVAVAGKTPPYPIYKKIKFPHGTKTAGVIAATANNGKGTAGVAAGNHNDLISLMGINVFGDRKYSSQRDASTEDIIKGLDYACAHGARVISMCLGHSPGSKDRSGKIHDDRALKNAIDDAVYNKNVVIVCSAGNHNNERTWYPSDFASTISVINTQQYGNAQSRKCKAPHSNYGVKKDLSAPGNGVYTTMPGDSYGFGSGTSYAAPSVAGIAALMLYVNPDLKAQEVKEILCSTATDLYTPGYDIYTGYGNVNAYRAVAAAAGWDRPIAADRSPNHASNVPLASGYSIEALWKSLPHVKIAQDYSIY